MTGPRIHTVTGGGGVGLHVRDWGPLDAPPIVLIHGWAQHHVCWRMQTGGDLVQRHRVVALDLRGHGMSDAPREPAAYSDGAPWAADIAAVIATLGLVRPILTGWSYGGRVIAEYLDVHGDSALGGIALTGAVLAIGAAREDWMVGPASPGLDRDLYTEDQPRRLAATARFVATCTHAPLPPAEYAELTGANMLVSAQVRRALFAADRDLRPVFRRVTCPVLITHGASDRIVAVATAHAAAEAMPHARLSVYPDTGHMPFREAPARFDADLAALAAGVIA